MKLIAAVALITLSLSIIMTKGMAQDGTGVIKPPVTEKKPKITEINGDRLVDNYFWLREKANPAVIAHLEAESSHPLQDGRKLPDWRRQNFAAVGRR